MTFSLVFQRNSPKSWGVTTPPPPPPQPFGGSTPGFIVPSKGVLAVITGDYRGGWGKKADFLMT